MIYLTPEQVLFLHAQLVAETGGSHGVRDLNLLLSALEKPQASFDDLDLYPDILAKAAALMDSLIRNHPFVDGNKRTSIVSAGIFLLLNEYKLITTNPELEKFTLEVARSEHSLLKITAWLQDNSRVTDQNSPV
jgi:death on curing protein